MCVLLPLVYLLAISCNDEGCIHVVQVVKNEEKQLSFSKHVGIDQVITTITPQFGHFPLPLPKCLHYPPYKKK